MKLKWTVDPAPTGPYRSFQGRSWPRGEANGEAAARILCEDDYRPANARSGEHKPLRVAVAQWNLTAEERVGQGAFRWRTLKATAATLPEAKALAERFFEAHPEYLVRSA